MKRLKRTRVLAGKVRRISDIDMNERNERKGLYFSVDEEEKRVRKMK